MSSTKSVFIAVIGPGGVGKCFLRQLADLAVRRPSPQLSLVYLANSKKAIFHSDYAAINISGAVDALAASEQPTPALDAVVEYLAAAPSKVVLVDNTSSDAVASAYPAFLRRGISVVTPNKKAFSGSLQLWKDIFAAAAASGAKVYHEASCGAGLPTISTVHDLVDTGDRITRIEGVMSGTLSFLFNAFMPGDPEQAAAVAAAGAKWSDEVAKAQKLGYTEPDPRDDLNGMDVARKLTILARLAGLDVSSPTAFPVESLIPEPLQTVASGDEYLARLPQYDAHMDAVRAAAQKQGRVVRYVGSVDVAAQQLRVGLQSVATTHPFAALQGSDNIFLFYTQRYGNNPLIIQGAGAGGDLTAMGVTADLLKVLSQMA